MLDYAIGSIRGRKKRFAECLLLRAAQIAPPSVQTAECKRDIQPAKILHNRIRHNLDTGGKRRKVVAKVDSGHRAFVHAEIRSRTDIPAERIPKLSILQA